MADTPDNYSSPNKNKSAVALGYDRENDPAPRIVASGRGEIAAQIIAIAQKNGVEIQQDRELVEILSVLDVDSVIPLEAYAAVAEILSYVYRRNAEKKQSRQY